MLTRANLALVFSEPVVGILVPAAPAACAPATAAATLLRLVAVTAVHRAITARFEGHRGLLTAAGADDSGASGLGPRISAPTTVAAATTGVSSSAPRLLVLLSLAARFAALRRGIAAFLEERLVFARKGKFLSAVATGELQISSHC